jgi:hypothetical protein
MQAETATSAFHPHGKKRVCAPGTMQREKRVTVRTVKCHNQAPYFSFPRHGWRGSHVFVGHCAQRLRLMRSGFASPAQSFYKLTYFYSLFNFAKVAPDMLKQHIELNWPPPFRYLA